MRRKKRCPFCKASFTPHPRLGNRQITCGSSDCKQKQIRSAKNRWARNNRAIIRANLKDWLLTKPGFWKKYRSEHPDYVERNRNQSRIRKTFLKAGLQNRTDILQPLVSQMQFWSFPRFAKRPRSIFPLLFAYKAAHAESISLHGG